MAVRSKIFFRRFRWPEADASRLRLLLVVVFFLIGVFGGQRYALRVCVDTDAEIRRYLEAYLQMDVSGGSRSIWMVFLAYFRYPALAFLLGFASVGVVLLPLVCTAQGFFLSFAVCCFSSAMGREGLLFLVATFAVRGLCTLTSLFALSAESLRTSWLLAQVSFGRGKHSGAVFYRKDTFIRFGICVIFLLIGAVLELTLVPGVIRFLAE